MFNPKYFCYQVEIDTYWGNRWTDWEISVETQKKLDPIRKGWSVVTDEEIVEAKMTCLKLFKSSLTPDKVQGEAHKDFIYLYNANKSVQLMVPTSGKDIFALKYDCTGIGTVDFGFHVLADFAYIKSKRMRPPDYDPKWGQCDCCTNAIGFGTYCWVGVKHDVAFCCACWYRSDVCTVGVPNIRKVTFAGHSGPTEMHAIDQFAWK